MWKSFSACTWWAQNDNDQLDSCENYFSFSPLKALFGIKNKIRKEKSPGRLVPLMFHSLWRNRCFWENLFESGFELLWLPLKKQRERDYLFCCLSPKLVVKIIVATRGLFFQQTIFHVIVFFSAWLILFFEWNAVWSWKCVYWYFEL